MRKQSPKGITNRRARYDYELGDELVVGISLTGAETKALRQGHGHLRGAYVVVSERELWLFNATITGTNSAPIEAEQQTRRRKLLAKRREIEHFITAKQQGLTIIPLDILTKGRYIKLRISTARGKKKYDKRQTIKAREENRNIQRSLT